jgi:hypothetical protein
MRACDLLHLCSQSYMLYLLVLRLGPLDPNLKLLTLLSFTPDPSEILPTLLYPRPSPLLSGTPGLC